MEYRKIIFGATLLFLFTQCGGGKTEESYEAEQQAEKAKWEEKKKDAQEEFKAESAKSVDKLMASLLSAVQFVESDSDTNIVVYKLDNKPIYKYDMNLFDSPDAFREKKNCVVLRFENLRNSEESTNRYYDESLVRMAAKMQENQYKFDSNISMRDLNLIKQLANCKYILISKEKLRLDPKVVRDDEGELLGFESGSISGFAYLIDVESGGLIARMPTEAQNSETIDYESQKVGDLKIGNHSSALEKDLVDAHVEDVYEVMSIAYPQE